MLTELTIYLRNIITKAIISYYYLGTTIHTLHCKKSVFRNTKSGGNASATTFGVSNHRVFRNAWCLKTPGVSKHQVFEYTGWFKTPGVPKHQKWWQTRFHLFWCSKTLVVMYYS